VKSSRKGGTPQGLPFEWPAPDVSDIGDFRHGTISSRDRDAINQTLPREIDREKLWSELEPTIKETRPARQIVEVLQLEIRELERAKQKLAPLINRAAADAVETRIAELREALRYYADLARQSRAQARFKRFRILRAWRVAGGKPTINTPDDAEGVDQIQKRGRGTPSGPLVEYFRTALRIICGEDREPETVKSLLYRDYRQQFHFQMIGSSLGGAGGLKSAV
jgi:hypothetical protein